MEGRASIVLRILVAARITLGVIIVGVGVFFTWIGISTGGYEALAGIVILFVSIFAGLVVALEAIIVLFEEIIITAINSSE